MVTPSGTPAVFTSISVWQELEAGETGLGHLGALGSKESKCLTTEELLWDVGSRTEAPQEQPEESRPARGHSGGPPNTVT